MTGCPASKCHDAGTTIHADADRFPHEIVWLLAVARIELDRHINDHGRCRACHMRFPCQHACQAEQILGWF